MQKFVELLLPGVSFRLISLYFFVYFQDHVIIQLDQTGLKARTKQDEQLVREEDPILVVHPNYIVDG